MTGTLPISVSGEFDAHPSRWLWLFKMFLALPHFLVLAVLWIAVIVVTLIAGLSILFTGRYPRPLWNFTAGVLRWHWRVGFYSYAALGTDRYPPFTLRATDHPATVEVEYPERLSRRLVLVKWLLAVPHLIIVVLVVADLLLYPWSGGTLPEGGLAAGYSILNLLVVIAGVFLLITGQYPRSLFDFLMGINRWLVRVFVFVALMRDEYPPFRFDAGPTSPESLKPPPIESRGNRR